MEEKKEGEIKSDDRKGGWALFIPAGIFLWFGVGFIINNIPAGMFVGMGIGFFMFAIATIFKK